ncbi:hypothetical protein FRC03_012002 [Tulasnella sp. 419]|nr:hypothetical protein FRC03_012002 [Tulasnella sp. 419]
MSAGASSNVELLRLGSGIGGKTLDYLLCARSESGKTLEGPCPNKGDHRCSECRLVKYCSKECQREHWRIHKLQCRHFYGSKDWEPAWTREKRTAAFMNDSKNYIQFGREGHYLWGNMPAADYLNLSHNEGMDQIYRDFNLCFAASGDIRNMVKTVNGLPENYQGKVSITMNDFNPYVTARNLILVCMLTDKLPPDVEELAEAAVHYSYSAALTSHQAQYLSYWMSQILAFQSFSPHPMVFLGGPVADDLTNVGFMFDYSILQVFKKLSGAQYSLKDALEDMRSVTLAPSRVDYRDRHLGRMRPPHRVSYLSHAENGMVLPFGAARASFTEPNRILFNEDGNWLLRDSANPLHGFDLVNAVAGGKKRHVPHEDLHGSLFFHVKDQFAEFARRARRFKMEFVFQNREMRQFAEFLKDSKSDAPSSTQSPFFFDRIDTSNVMDSIGIEAILRAWAPLLNPKNEHSALIAYSMNWIGKQHDGQPGPGNPAVYTRALRKVFDFQAKDTSEWNKARLLTNAELNTSIRALQVPAFHDNEPAFNTFLKREKLPEVCKSLNIRRRNIHRIHTKRLGIPLDNHDQKIHNLNHEDFYTLSRFINHSSNQDLHS